jgi:hypothetical protein
MRTFSAASWIPKERLFSSKDHDSFDRLKTSEGGLRMAAVNKDPFVRTLNKDGLPVLFRGKVQAGTTQAIKVGEICAFNKTAGYWIPVAAINDFIYALAIAKEEQTAADLARYVEFYALHPNDQFEFEIDAARALALGDTFILTVSNSQKLTYSAGGYPVARCVDDGHYPQKTDTTIRNRSWAVVSFDPSVSYWGLVLNGSGWNSKKVVTATAAITLYSEMSGLVILNTGISGGTVHVLPLNPPAGCNFTAYNTAADAHGFDPPTDGGIYGTGAKNGDGDTMTIDAIGDAIEVVAIGDKDWIMIVSAAGNEHAAAAVTAA